MNRNLLSVGALAAAGVFLTVGATKSCAAPQKAATDTGVSGVVNGRDAHQTHAGTPCAPDPPIGAECLSGMRLSLTDSHGVDHLVAVSRVVYDRCGLGTSYPECAKEGQR